MFRKILLVISLVSSAAAISFAQQITISGSVFFEGENGTAVSQANIVVEDPSDHNVLGYASTSETGLFSVSLDTDKSLLQLIVTGFNIERKIVEIEGRSQNIFVLVKYKEISLKGAKIKTESIKSKGDTTSYYVSMFADSLDRSIGDVIKKMPGLSLDKSGAIRFQGVRIDKFYIEGLDMMGSRYGILTNNIRAKDVASVEVFENHQPIKILQSARGEGEASGKVAVNLKLKQKSKGAFIGSVQAGIGCSPFIWDGGFVGMFFSDNFQSLTTLKSNNSGEDIISELQEQFDGLKWLSPIVGVYSPQTPELDVERYMDNATYAASSNNLFKLGSNKILSINGVYIHDSQSFEDLAISKYYFASADPLEIDEETKKLQRTDNAELRLKYTDNSYSHYITEVFTMGARWDHSNGAVSTPEDLINQDFIMAANKSLCNQFRFDSKKKGRVSFGIKTDVGYNDLPASLQVTPTILPELLGYGQISGSSSIQSYSVSRANADITPNISIALSRGWDLYASTSISFKSQKMNSLLNFDGMNAVSDDFRNDNRYRRWDAKSGIALFYSRNTLKMNFMLDAGYAKIDYTDKVRQTSGTKNGLFFHPSIFLNYSFSPKLKISVFSSYDDDFADIGDIYAGNIMTDYRRIYSRDGDLAKNKTYQSNLKLIFSHPLRGFFAAVDFMYWGRNSNIIYGTEFIGNISNIKSYSLDNHSSGYSTTVKISKLFDAISSTFDLVGGFDRYSTEILRQMELFNTDTKKTMVGLSCISNIGRKVKTRYEIDCSYYKTRYDDVSSSNPIKVVHQRLSAEYQVLKGVIVKMSGEHYFNSAAFSDTRHIAFLDGSVLYKIKGCDIIFEARNLLNTKEYSYSFNSDATEFQSAYRLRPRTFSLKVRININ